MRIERRFTTEGADAYDTIPFRRVSSSIKNLDGSTVFALDNVEVPATWSQVASDVLAQKYFRKAGVPAILKTVFEEGLPIWLMRREADTEAGKHPSGRLFGFLNVKKRKWLHLVVSLSTDPKARRGPKAVQDIFACGCEFSQVSWRGLLRSC